MTDADKGLYQKYVVLRRDGSSEVGGKHERCRYFVLDLDHDKFAVPALRAYADACEAEFPELAADLRADADAHDPVVLAAYDAHQEDAALRIFGPVAGTSGPPGYDTPEELAEALKQAEDLATDR